LIVPESQMPISGPKRMSKISVLYIVDTVGEDAGTERYVVNTLQRLNRDQFHLHLCCLADSERLRAFQPLASTAVFPVVSVWTRNGWRQIRALRRYINENNVDILHAFTPKATIVGVLAAKRSRAKVIIASRRNLGYWYTPFHLRLFRYLNRHTTRLLANSERVRQNLIQMEHARPEKIDVLYNGVDMERFAPKSRSSADVERLGIPPGAPLVGIVANYRPVKDLPLFLRAAAIVSEKVPEAAFLLAGQGPLREELTKLSQELGIAHKVFFTDGTGSVADYLARMRVACLSSSSEGFSNAILEYMAAGLPVVATDVGGNAEAVQDGVTGYIVRDREPASFATPIVNLLRSDETRSRMAAAALARCKEKFSMEKAIEELEAYYRNLVEKRR
jgi:glycosyltransferase involved in cell wall biosynthesis